MKNINVIGNEMLDLVDTTIGQAIAEIEDLQWKYADNSDVQLELIILDKHQNILSEAQRILSSLVEDKIISNIDASQEEDISAASQRTAILAYL